MPINITQTCDALCGSTRALKLDYGRNRNNLDDVAQEGGWIELDKNKYLCPACVKQALIRYKESQ